MIILRKAQVMIQGQSCYSISQDVKYKVTSHGIVPEKKINIWRKIYQNKIKIKCLKLHLILHCLLKWHFYACYHMAFLTAIPKNKDKRGN